MLQRSHSDNALSSDWFTLKQENLINRANLLLDMDEHCRALGIKLEEAGVCCGLVCNYLMQKDQGKSELFFNALHEFSLPLDMMQSKISPHLDGSVAYNDKSQVISHIKKIYTFQYPEKLNKELEYNSGCIEHIAPEIAQTFGVGVRWELKNLHKLMSMITIDRTMIFVWANGHAIGIYKIDRSLYLYDPNQQEELECTSIRKLTDCLTAWIFIEPGDETIDIKMSMFRFKHLSQSTTSTYPDTAQIAKTINPFFDPGYFYTMRACVEVNATSLFRDVLKLHANPLIGQNGKGSIFDYACHLNKPDIVEIILDRNDIVSWDDLKFYADVVLKKGRVKLSLILLQYMQIHYPVKMRSEAEDVFRAACMGGTIEAMEYLNSRYIEISVDNPFFYKFIESSLREASTRGDSRYIAYILKKLPFIKSKRDFKRCTLNAIHDGNYSAYCELAKSKNAVDEDMLDYAVIHCKERRIITHMLISEHYRCTINFSHMVTAARACKPDVLLQLLAHPERYNPAELTEFESVTRALNGSVSDCKWFFERVQAYWCNAFAQKVLLMAIQQNNTPLIDALKQLDVKLDPEDNEACHALLLAVYHGKSDVARSLLSVGVSPYHTLKITRCSQKKNLDALSIAIYKNDPLFLRLLLTVHPDKIPIKREIIARFSSMITNVDRGNHVDDPARYLDSLLALNILSEEEKHQLLSVAIQFKKTDSIACLMKYIDSFPVAETQCHGMDLQSEAEEIDCLNKIREEKERVLLDRRMLDEQIAHVTKPLYDELAHYRNSTRSAADLLNYYAVRRATNELVELTASKQLTAEAIENYQALSNKQSHTPLKKAMNVLAGTLIALSGLALLGVAVSGLVFSFVGFPAVLTAVFPTGLLLVSAGVSTVSAALGIGAGVASHHQFFKVREKTPLQERCEQTLNFVKGCMQ